MCGTGLCLFSLAIGMLMLGAGARAQEGYQKPPKAVLDVLNAPVTPRASVGRARDIVLLYSAVPYPPIAELARPFVRLAGLRVDASNNGPHNPPRFENLVLKKVAESCTACGFCGVAAFLVTGRKEDRVHTRHGFGDRAMGGGCEKWGGTRDGGRETERGAQRGGSFGEK